MIEQLTDKAYFVEMIYTHMGIIYKICKLYAQGEDQEDLKQEIIYQLWRSYPNYRGNSKFQTWMYRVALNTAMLGLRAQKIKYTGLGNENLRIPELPPDYQGEDARVNQLYAEISKLKDLDKTIIFLYLEEFSYDEIAGITGISSKNVSVRLVRIREGLRKKINMLNSRS